jgi:glycosyltransferase involved in cell wall biosynthesis
VPRVSVIVPTYNCASFIERAIESAFAQTYADYEIIVVDDGSTDGTDALLARWHGRITSLRQANSGLSTARNTAAGKATGEFLAYLDADDVWYPTKLDHQIAFLDAHSECGMVHSELTVIDESDRILFREWYRESKSKPASGMCIMELLENLHIQVPTVVERRAIFDRIGGFDARQRRCEDYLHWMELLLDGHAVGYIDQPLAMYRRRSGSLSRGQAAMAAGLIGVFRTLIEENNLYQRIGTNGQEIVRRRMAALERRLLKCYRWEGRNDLARRAALNLIRESPAEANVYVEFLRACLPPIAAARLRKFRTASHRVFP